VGSGLAAEAGHGIDGIETEEQPGAQIIKSRAIRIKLMALIRTRPSGFFRIIHAAAT
jgi:hypothetical protein